MELTGAIFLGFIILAVCMLVGLTSIAKAIRETRELPERPKEEPEKQSVDPEHNS